MKPIKILLVEDNDGYAVPFKQYFEACGEFEVYIENWGAQALVRLPEVKPDIVVLDWDLANDRVHTGDLKRADGSVVAGLIRKDLLGAKLPILILTQLKTIDEAEEETRAYEGQNIFWMSKRDGGLEKVMARLANILYRV